MDKQAHKIIAYAGMVIVACCAIVWLALAACAPWKK